MAYHRFRRRSALSSWTEGLGIVGVVLLVIASILFLSLVPGILLAWIASIWLTTEDVGLAGWSVFEAGLLLGAIIVLLRGIFSARVTVTK